MGLTRDLESRRNNDFDFEQFSSITSSISNTRSSMPQPSQALNLPPYSESNLGYQPGALLGLGNPGSTPIYQVQKSSVPVPHRGASRAPKGLLRSTAADPNRITLDIDQINQRAVSQRFSVQKTPNDFHQTVTVVQNNQKTSIEISSLLHYFWTKSTDLKCLVCHRDFKDKDPAIRTISLEENASFSISIGPPPASIAIRVHTRHLECLKETRVAFIPVSHVWNQAIAEACVSKKTSNAAAECLFNVIAQVLPITTAKFESLYGRVELWHDYISIPQWHHEAQQSLLLMLPDIFRIAPLCLVQLDDIPASTIAAAARFDNITAQSEQYAMLASFYRAKWFERMWVSVEYAYCNQACVYTMDGVIMCTGGEMMCDSFSFILAGFEQQMRRIVGKIGGQKFEEYFRQIPTPILGPLGDMRRSVKNGFNLTFGEALSFVAGRNCRDYQDRFLAMCGFLNIGHYADVLAQIPKEPIQACLWLAQICIERGDYSPLLLLQNGESEVQGARWLVGHQSMVWHMWDLGAATAPSASLCCSLSSDCISLELDLVGSLESLYQPIFRNGDPIKAFDYLLSNILSYQSGPDVAALITTLERIYGVPEFLRTPEVPVALSEYLQTIPDFIQNLEEQLTMYLKEKRVPEARLSICRKMAKFLGLFNPLRGSLESFSRLTYAGSPLGISSRYDDAVGAFRCEVCAQIFLYRIILLKEVDTRVRLYRIPELGYMSSLTNGVGLLVSDRKIIGRMIYGTPACNCRMVERFEIY